MALRGAPLLVLVVLATGAAFAAVVGLWDRVAGHGPLGLLRRAGALLGVCGLVLLSAAVALNDQYGFYADWTDLGTAVSGPAAPAAGAAAGAGPALGSAATGVRPLTHNSPVRTVLGTVTGRRTGISAPVLVILPAGYDDPENAARSYPVVEALHGLPGGPQGWTAPALDLRPALAAETAAHRVADVVVVAPTIDVPKGRDTECVDAGPSAPAVETWLADDVPTWLTSSFRVQQDRQAWATLGISVGAWCAAELGMLHPDRFGGAVVLGGYFRPVFDRWRPFAPGDPRLARYDLVALAHRAPPPVALWVETSPADDLSWPTTQQLLAAARPPTTVHADVLAHAGHRTAVWRPLEPVALDWLAQTLPPFAPVP